MKALRSFTVRPRLPEALAPLERAGHEPALVVGQRRPATCSAGSTPTRWDATGPRPGPAARARSPRPARRAGRRPGVPALPRRGPRRAPPLPRRAPLVPEPATADSPLRHGRLLLARVRHRRGAARSTPAASACWPATTSRRPATSACPLVGVGLFYRHGYFRQALDATAGSRSASPTSTRYAMALTPVRGRPGRASTWPASRSSPRCGGPTSAGCRCTCSTPTSTRTPPELRTVTDRLYGGDTEHRLRQEILLGIGGVRALRGARHRRRRCSTPTRATPASSASSASAELMVDDGPRPSPRRSRRCGPAASSPPTPRCPPASTASPASSWSATSAAGPSECGVDARRAHGARPPPGDEPDEPLQHGGHGPAPGRPVQRASPSCTARSAGEMFADLWPDVPAEEVPIGVGHQRRARRHVGVGRDERPARAGTCCPTGTRPTPTRWARIADVARRRAVAGRASRAASASSASSATGCAQPRWRGACRRRDVAVDRRGARPDGAHDRLRPPLRHLQAGHAAAVAARAAAGAAAVAPTGRCSSCSPARPTRPTTRGKEMIRQIVHVRRRPRRAPPLRVPRRLRHRRRPHARTRAPTCG